MKDAKRLLIELVNLTPPCEGCEVAHVCAEGKLTCSSFRSWVRGREVLPLRGEKIKDWSDSFPQAPESFGINTLPPMQQEPREGIHVSPLEQTVVGHAADRFDAADSGAPAGGRFS